MLVIREMSHESRLCLGDEVISASSLTVPLRAHMRPSLFSPHQYLRIFLIVNITTYTTYSAIMGGKKGENTKKVAGNAKVQMST